MIARKLLTVGLILSVALALTPTTTGQTPQWSDPSGLKVYILRGGDPASDNAVAQALQERGHVPTLGVETPDWNGSQANLNDFDVVVILITANWARALSSQGIEAIRNYIVNGGAVVTGEWFIWKTFGDQTIGPLMPVVDYCGWNYNTTTTYTQLAPDSVINSGLPVTLTLSLSDFAGTESCFRPRAEARIFYSSSNGGGQPRAAGLLGWDVQGGRVASFSTLIANSELANTDYRRLFVNTVEWVALVRSDILRITALSSNAGGNTGTATITIWGSGFKDGTEARLLEGNQVVLIGQNTVVDSRTQLRTTFDLQGQEARPLTLQVSNPDGASTIAPGMFTIVNGGWGELAVDLIGPAQVRVGREAVFTAVIRNEGLIDSDVVFVSLAAEVDQANQSVGPFAPDQLPWPLFQISTAIPRLPPGWTESISLRGTFPTGDCATIRAWVKRTEEGKKILRRLEEKIRNGTAEEREEACQDVYILEQESRSHREKWIEFLGEDYEEFAGKLLELKGLCDSSRNTSNSVNVEQPDTTLPVCPVTSWDPNDKTNLTGLGEAKYVRGTTTLPYTVFFENLATATAPAEEVLVTDQLDSNLDWSTFALDTIRIGEITVTVPFGVQSFTSTIDLRPVITAVVEADLDFDQITGRVEWVFRGKDPNTGELTGFLPPNTPDVAPRGEGSVSYSVRPRQKLATGTIITNIATIDFEIGIPPAPMDTREVTNTVDSDSPASQIITHTAIEGPSNFEIGWSGTDAGSGIGSYTIYVSDNDGPYVPWLTSVLSTTATFSGQPGHIYCFFSRARDKVGNYESLPITRGAWTCTSYEIYLPVILKGP